MTFQSNKAAGFSLVEVMCAIAIVGFALTGLTLGISTALSSTKESEVQSTAALLAAGQMEFIRADGFLIEGTDEGDFGEDFPLYQWRQTITESKMPGLYEVMVVVENARTGLAIYELKTLLFDPPSESSIDRSMSPERKRQEKKRERRRS
jgi:prepilin-type N-terminal cleavage/methylation domain-containing protein